MASTGKEQQFLEKECTPKCHSSLHADLLLSCVTKGSAAEIRSYCNWLCYNFASVADKFGKNILHIASSTGKWQIVYWLLEHCHCDVGVRDWESGWTALHRSFFYGQLACARVLLNHGANLKMTDHEGLTALDLITEDRLPYVEYNSNYPQDVYVWGSNVNYNLGLGNEQSRQYPEVLEFFRKENTSIKQVVICKFHTVFLLSDGRLYTCGHGHGGRLGQGTESTGLSPSPVQGLGSAQCQQVAAGQDHLILLMDSGQVWTCGLNTYHQLGHNPPPERLLTPRPLSLKFLKGKEVVGVCAARFHSVFYTKDSLYTFGLNAGQLGHPKGGRTIVSPHQVSSVYNKDWRISHVVASDGATVCATNRGDVYVLHEFQHRKIASKQLGIQMLSVVGGYLDSSCDAAGIREGGGLELRVLLLVQSGKLYLWRQNNPYLRRCLFTSTIQPIISNVHLNHYSISAVTHDNKALTGSVIQPFREKKSSTSSQVSSPAPPKSQSTTTQSNPFIDRDDCYLIRAKRLPYVHRATTITSDTKGRNFAVLQASPKIGLVELPVVSESQMQKQLLTLFEEASVHDTFHDVIIKVGNREYPAHKYILASRSDYFRKQLENSSNIESITIDNIVPEAFEQALKFMYGNTCNFLQEGHEVRWGKLVDNVNGKNIKNSSEEKAVKNVPKKKSKTNAKDFSPVECVQQASRCFNLNVLTKMLQYVKIINGSIHVNSKDQLPKLRFDRLKLTEYHDVILCAEDGVEFPAHRCILAARSDYFHSMLGSCWLEKSQLKCLSLPIPSRVLKVLLNYLYSDADSQIHNSEDPEFLCNVLVVADQLLIGHLKEMCEMALVNLLGLKNAPELLELASIYSADQLKKACMEYICINLPAIIEAKNLDVLSDEVMEELSRTYRNMIPSMQRRLITPNPSAPFGEELEQIERSFPIGEDHAVPRQKMAELFDMKFLDMKSKTKRKVTINRQESKNDVTPFSDTKSRCDSESSEKDILLDIIDIHEEFKKEVNTPLVKSSPQPIPPSPNSCRQRTQKLVGWTTMSPKEINEKILSLSEIIEEGKRMTLLQKSSGKTECKQKMSRISQKQKKLMAKEAAQQVPATLTDTICSSPPSCPWGKASVDLVESPSSFWDAMTKGELQSPPNSRNFSSIVPSSPQSPGSSSSFSVEESPIISLEAIQKAEEEAQHKSVPLKAKSLNLISIEDQAIEELLVLYRAFDNPRERVTVSRILPDNIASPVWKKNATRSFQL